MQRARVCVHRARSMCKSPNSSESLPRVCRCVQPPTGGSRALAAKAEVLSRSSRIDSSRPTAFPFTLHASMPRKRFALQVHDVAIRQQHVDGVYSLGANESAVAHIEVNQLAAAEREREWCQDTRHTSHVTRHTSHVTRHTSHVTRHTSHITHHTSHFAGRPFYRHFYTLRNNPWSQPVNLFCPRKCMRKIVGVASDEQLGCDV